MMNTDISKLAEYEVDFKPAYMCDKFMNVSNSQMVEICQRTALISYLLESKRVIIT